MNRLKEIPIKQHENQYFACENGKIFKWSCIKEEFTEVVGWKEKSAVKYEKLYWRVGIYLNKIRKQFYKHRLILKTFKGMPKPGQLARHLDDNSLNNQINNLEWGSHQDNTDDRIKNENKSNGLELDENMDTTAPF